MQSFVARPPADVSSLLSTAIGVQREAFSMAAASFENAGQGSSFTSTGHRNASGALDPLLSQSNSALSTTLNGVMNGRSRVS